MNFRTLIKVTLQKIDDFFKEKSQKEIFMIYSMIAAILFAIAYPFYSSYFNEFASSKKRVKNITAKFDAQKLTLKQNSEAKRIKLDREIQKIKSHLLTQTKINKYIHEKIKSILSISYNEKVWGRYLHSISFHAKKYNIKIVNFSNKYRQKNESLFGPILDIVLDIQGEYIDTLRFMNALEQSNLAVDLHTFEMRASNTLHTHLDISIWGVHRK